MSSRRDNSAAAYSSTDQVPLPGTRVTFLVYLHVTNITALISLRRATEKARIKSSVSVWIDTGGEEIG